MAKIHPNYQSTSSVSSSCCRSPSQRDVFTVWMKSLMFHGKGCTAFDSRGEVIFRVDNYQQRCSSEVYLMDFSGKVLFSIKRKGLRIFGCWEGFRWIDDNRVSNKSPWFRATRKIRGWSKSISCRVSLKCGDMGSCYIMTGLEGKSEIRITDSLGQVLAEAVQKQSSEGVPLGDDVLTLMVKPKADQSLIMALVTVYGLITDKL